MGPEDCGMCNRTCGANTSEEKWNPLGEMCLAQFAKMFKSYSNTRSEENKNEHVKEDEVDEDEDDDYATDYSDDKFNYVMTHKNEEEKCSKDPRIYCPERSLPWRTSSDEKAKLPSCSEIQLN